MRRVVVGSQNPVKVAAAKTAIERFLGEDVEAVGAATDAGVSDQPMSDEETRRGAEQRAQNVLQMFPESDFAVGIEGGIEINDGQMLAFAWVVVLKHGRSGRSRSGTFQLPPRVCQLVQAGKELGHANDEVFSTKNSKQHGGAVGLLTDGAISRQQLYEHAVELALIPMRNEELFSDSNSSCSNS